MIVHADVDVFFEIYPGVLQSASNAKDHGSPLRVNPRVFFFIPYPRNVPTVCVSYKEWVVSTGLLLFLSFAPNVFLDGYPN